MDILIKNIEPPKSGDWISLRIDADGKVINYDGRHTTWVKLPPHGKLVELDKIIMPVLQIDKLNTVNDVCNLLCELINEIRNAPTVLEASK